MAAGEVGMTPAISQVCTLGSDFAADLDEFAAAGFSAVEVWLTKLEQFAESRGIAEAASMARHLGVELPVAAMQGGLVASRGPAQTAALDHFQRRLDLLAELGTTTLVLAADVPHPLAPDDPKVLQSTLVTLADRVAPRGITLALEFQSSSALVNNLQTAVALVAQVGHPHLGICLDTFHFLTGPSKESDLELLDSSNLRHVQVSDLSDRPRELAGNSDRILPGEGDFPWEALMRRLRAIDYRGPISLEVMNPAFMRGAAAQLAYVARQALDRILAVPEHPWSSPAGGQDTTTP